MIKRNSETAERRNKLNDETEDEYIPVPEFSWSSEKELSIASKYMRAIDTIADIYNLKSAASDRFVISRCIACIESDGCIRRIKGTAENDVWYIPDYITLYALICAGIITVREDRKKEMEREM